MDQIGNFPTKIIRHEALSEFLGINLFVKNEFEADAFGGGNKIRRLKYYLKYFQDNKITDIIAEGDLQSNLCMVLAHYFVPMGYRVHLVLTGEEPNILGGNLLQMHISGAKTYKIGHWDLNKIRSKKKEIKDNCESLGRKSFFVESDLTDNLALQASIELAKEIHNQESELNQVFDYIFVAAGTGITHAGIEIYKQMHDLAWKVMGVSIANQFDFFRNYHSDIYKLFGHKILVNDFNILTSFIGRGYAKYEYSDIDNLLSLRRKYGLILDSTYTYKCFKAIIDLASQKQILSHSNVLFIHTGGINQRFFPPYSYDK